MRGVVMSRDLSRSRFSWSSLKGRSIRLLKEAYSDNFNSDFSGAYRLGPFNFDLLSGILSRLLHDELSVQMEEI